MIPEKNKGLWLRRKPDGNRSNWLICAISAGITCILVLLAAAELAAFPGGPLPMVICAAAVCTLYGLLKYFGHQQHFYIGSLALLVLIVILFRSSLTNGIGHVWNALAYTRTAATGYMVRTVRTSGAAGITELLPVSILIGSVAALLCCVFSDRNRPLLAVLLVAAVLFCMVFFRSDAGFLYLIPALAAATVLLTIEESSRHNSYRSVLMRLLTASIAVLAALSMAQLPAVKEWAAQTGHRVQKSAHVRIYETDYSTLPEGDFSEFISEEDAAHPALAVTMETAEPLYLRGFTGAAFTDGRWFEIEPDILAENAQLLYWLNTNEFPLQSQFAAAAVGLNLETNQITVQNVGACSRYRYVPFSLCSDGAPDFEDLNPDSLTGHGKRVDTYRVVSHSAQQLQPVLEALQTANDETILRYRSAESAYRDFVYDNYLQIPQEAMTMLQPQWDRVAGAHTNMNLQTAQSCALAFLELCFSEAKSPVDLPLSQAVGTDYRYATVAVLTLRYFGIPARYAEGYVITEAMAKRAEAGAPIQVDSSCAGAWAEVYHDGIGWIPMALTQGPQQQSEDTEGEEEEATGSSRSDLKEGEELEKAPETPVQEDKPKGGYMVTLRKAIRLGGLLIVATVILLLILCILRRKIVLRKRMECFCQENKKLATPSIFSHCARLLEEMGYCRGTGSMEALCQPVCRDLGPAYAQQLRDSIALNSRAIFSSRPLDQTQWEAMFAFYETTLQHMNERISPVRKLWLKWIHCLL